MNTFDNVMMGLLVTCLGPFGQLLARALYLNGSLDKWWLILIPIFWLPPFSIGAYVAMLMGYVAQGQGSKPFDSNLLITFLGTMGIPLIFNGFELNENIAGTFIQTIIMFLMIMVPMYMREATNCEDQSIKKKADLTRVMFNASVAHLLGIVFKIVLSVVIDYTPIGLVFSALETIIPFIQSFKEALLYSLGVSTAVLGTNMVQATDLNSYCSTDKPIWSTALVSIGSLLLNTGYEYYRE